jgi:uncharacterized membrane protein
MNLDFRLLLGLWALLAATVLALIVWRKTVARNEDDQVHLLHTEAVPHQAAVAHKLEQIDKWGKIVTAVTIAYGVLIAGLFTYQTGVQTSTTVPGA